MAFLSRGGLIGSPHRDGNLQGPPWKAWEAGVVREETEIQGNGPKRGIPYSWHKNLNTYNSYSAVETGKETALAGTSAYATRLDHLLGNRVGWGSTHFITYTVACYHTSRVTFLWTRSFSPLVRGKPVKKRSASTSGHGYECLFWTHQHCLRRLSWSLTQPTRWL